MIYRNTVQRAMTLEAVRRLHSHPTAEEVYRQVAAEYPSISRATVYRNLRQLAESGLLLKINTTDGADHFDHRCDAHYHAGFSTWSCGSRRSWRSCWGIPTASRSADTTCCFGACARNAAGKHPYNK